NGEQIAQKFVVDFVKAYKGLIEEVQPSFFEATVAMAFDYFAKENVDIAVIEVGLGGRLDSTNIIAPEVCLITNIGMDHMNLLGDTLEEIAAEKAGIIKAGIPVVISETNEITADVFIDIAVQEQAPITFADQYITVKRLHKDPLLQTLEVEKEGEVYCYDLDLTGSYQTKNIVGVLAIVDQLRENGFALSEEQLREALAHVQTLTGLQGRWQTLSSDPLIICDTGHNED